VEIKMIEISRFGDISYYGTFEELKEHGHLYPSQYNKNKEMMEKYPFLRVLVKNLYHYDDKISYAHAGKGYITVDYSIWNEIRFYEGDDYEHGSLSLDWCENKKYVNCGYISFGNLNPSEWDKYGERFKPFGELLKQRIEIDKKLKEMCKNDRRET